MLSRMRWGIAAALTAVVLVGCSESRDQGLVAPSSGSPASVAATGAAPGSVSARPTPAQEPATGASTPSAQRSSPGLGSATAARQAEWHLVVRSPRPQSQVSSPFDLEYEVTGPSRSADLVLEVRLEDPPGEGPDAAPRRYAIEAGRGTVAVEVGKLSTGRHDLRVRLLVSGIEASVVVVEDLRISGDRSTAG